MSFENARLREQVSQLVRDRSRLERTNLREAGQIGNMENRVRRSLGRDAAGAVASAAAQEGNPTSFGDALDLATRRAKMRNQITRQGENQAAQRTLMERIGFAKRGRSRQGQLVGSIGTASNIQAGLNVGLQRANDLRTSARYDMFGGLAGGVAGLLKNNFSGIWGGNKGYSSAAYARPAGGVGPVP